MDKKDSKIDSQSTPRKFLWRQQNPDKVKAIRQRYLLKNKEIVQLRRQRNWLFVKLGRGMDVSKQISELEIKISTLVAERDNKTYWFI